MFKIVMTKEAEKEYRYLYRTNRAIFERVRKAIYAIADAPYEGKNLKLELKGKLSWRVGVYRIIYSIENSIMTLYVLDIGHRRDVYR